jgi:hypothetical protein
MLLDTIGTSLDVIKKVMNKEMPMIPSVYMPCCDVRDVIDFY